MAARTVVARPLVRQQRLGRGRLLLGQPPDRRSAADRGVEGAGRLLAAEGDRRGDRLAQQRGTDADDVGIREEPVQEGRNVVEGFRAAELEEEDGAAAHSVRENTGFSGAASR